MCEPINLIRSKFVFAAHVQSYLEAEAPAIKVIWDYLRETFLTEGGAAQNVMRWQDYTQTAVAPSDDCTVWYVGDYVKAGETNYSTRIGAFRMAGCRASK